MATWYVDSAASTNRADINSTVVVEENRCYVSTDTGVIFECTVGGTTAASPPTFDTTPGNTTVDGGATWTAREHNSWDNAAPTLDHLLTGETIAAADEIWLEDGHVEGAVVSTTYTFTNGTLLDPIKVVSVDKVDDSYSPGATIDVNGTINDDVNIYGYTTWYGVTLEASDNIALGNGEGDLVKLVDCILNPDDQVANSTNSYVGRGIVLEDCTVSIKDTGSTPSLQLNRNAASFVMRGGSLSAPLTVTAGLIICKQALAGDAQLFLFEDVDLSDWPSGTKLFDNSTDIKNTYIFRRCKLPSGYVLGTLPKLSKLIIESCSTTTSTVPFLGVTTYKDDWGTVESDVTDYRNGGATDGENEFSWKVTSNAVTYESPLELPPIGLWVEPGASPKTLTLYIAGANDLTDDKIWAVVESPSEDVPANPNHKVSTSRPDPRTTGTNVSVTRDTGSTWEGSNTGVDGGLGQQKITISGIDATEAGPLVVRVYIAAASDTRYIDPKPVIS